MARIVDPESPEVIALTTPIATEHNIVNPVSTDTNGNPVTDSAGNPAGRVSIDGLTNSIERVSAATKTAAIKGFRLLNKGTGTLTISPSDGSTDVVVTAAELTAMGDSAYVDWPVHCDSVTAGTGMELIVYL